MCMYKFFVIAAIISAILSLLKAIVARNKSNAKKSKLNASDHNDNDYEHAVDNLIDPAYMPPWQRPTEAQIVNGGISSQAGQFKCKRRVTVYNAKKGTITFECEGYLDISNNKHNELVIAVKTGASTYKRNCIYLNSYTFYIVEDLADTHIDIHH